MTRKDTTMTTTEPRRAAKKSRAGERMLAVGLASTACIGLVGVIGVRAAQSDEVEVEPVDYAEPTSSQGLTRADLDAYAAQLADQAAQLKDYRQQLKAVAKQLNEEIGDYNEALAAGEPIYVEVPVDNGWSGGSNTPAGGNSGGGNSGGGNAPAPQPQPQPQPQAPSNSS